MKLTPFLRNILWASPLYLLVPLPFYIIAHYLKIDIDYKLILLGALGWWLALIIRIPLIVFIKKRNIDLKTSSRLTIGMSGPAEETVRLIILIQVGFSISNAYSLGLGWAMIEIIYGLIQIIGLGVLERKTDAKALEAKAFMKQMGMDKTLESSIPYWGVLERVSATAIHIGFSLLLTFSPLFILISTPLHSLVNFYVVKMNKISISKSQLGLFTIGLILMVLAYIISIKN